MSNYYKPTIEEFHIGFEFEYQGSFTSQWISMTYTRNTSFDITPTTLGNKIYLESVRVKCLDEEDIESLGFKKRDLKKEREKKQYENDHQYYHPLIGWMPGTFVDKYPDDSISVSPSEEDESESWSPSDSISWSSSISPSEENDITFTKGKFIIEFEENNEYKYNILIEKNHSTIFKGTIKNKSELKVLLKQLGIDEN
jgi:hypothetical protein